MVCRRGPRIPHTRAAGLLAEADAAGGEPACGALRRHGLFAQLAPLMYPNSLNALDAACDSQAEAAAPRPRLYWGREFWDGGAPPGCGAPLNPLNLMNHEAYFGSSSFSRADECQLSALIVLR